MSHFLFICRNQVITLILKINFKKNNKNVKKCLTYNSVGCII